MQSRKASRKAVSREKEAGRSQTRGAILVSRTILTMEGTPVHQKAFSLRGAGAGG